jgi:GMP synthase-like glutamine amidotransferase
MKPVVVFRQALVEGAGYLGTLLDEKGIPWQMVRIDQGEPIPSSVFSYSGLVLMGGPMSVNDHLPWIPPLLSLIRASIAQDIPVLGHCLGGQLMSKALGARVYPNPVKEIGWGLTEPKRTPEAQAWFGASSLEVFHWHGETFELPAGATHLLSSQHCENQAYVIGKHLAMQCHIEMTEEMVKTWCAIGADELADALGTPGVQPPHIMQQNLPARIQALNRVARPVYERWIAGLRR